MSSIATAIIAAAVTAGVSASSAHQTRKQVKSAAHEADVQNQKAVADAQADKDASSSRAREALAKRRREMVSSKSVFTNPNTKTGSQAEVSTIKKTLLGQ